MPKSISFQNEFRTRFTVDLNRTDFFLLSAALFDYYCNLKILSKQKSLKSVESDNLKDCFDRCYTLFRLFDELYHEV